MSDGTGRSSLLPSWLRGLPVDLAIVIGSVVLIVLWMFVPVANPISVRVLLALVFVVVVPGYALVAVLYPQTGDAPSDSRTGTDALPATVDGPERAMLSVAASIALVALVGLAVSLTPWGPSLSLLVFALGAITLGLTVVAVRRRRAVPEGERFRLPYDRWAGGVREGFLRPETRSDAALDVLVALTLVLAVASVGYAVAVPIQGNSFTEFYLLAENQDGELVAEDYPRNFTAGQGQSLVVGIENHERRPVNYTVVVELHRVQIRNDSTTVLAESELRRFEPRLAHDETWHRQHTVRPEMTGERLRLTYLLYKGSPPATPTISNAYREAHLWITVSD